MKQGVATGMDLVAHNIAQRLDILVAILERSIGTLAKTISETTPRVSGDEPIRSPELVTSIQQAVDELRKLLWSREGSRTPFTKSKRATLKVL